MKRLIIFAIGLSLLTACSEPEEKIIDVKDLMKTSQDDELNEPNDPTMPYEDELLEFQEAEPSLDSIVRVADKHFLKRFGHDTSFVFVLLSPSDSILYHEYRYSDSAKVQSALFNWIDHASRGESVRIGTPVRLNHRTFELFVNDTMMVLLEGSSLNFKAWEDFYLKKGHENWKYILRQSGKSKAKWYSMEDKKLKAIEEK